MGRKKKSKKTAQKKEEQAVKLQNNSQQQPQKQQATLENTEQITSKDVFQQKAEYQKREQHQEQQQYRDYDEQYGQGSRYRQQYNEYDEYEPNYELNKSFGSYGSYESGRPDRVESGSQYDQEERLQREYKYTSQDAKRLSKIGKRRGDLKFSIEECRDQIYDQLLKLNKYYKYRFDFDQQPDEIKGGKRMTRTIYLSFECNRCPQTNKWTSISGTFQITFSYDHQEQLLVYHVEIFRTQCRLCKSYMQPFVYQTQMDAMRMFFSVIITNIIDNVPPPQRPRKYYIKENHWHKTQWCEACQLGRCATQRNLPPSEEKIQKKIRK